MPEEMNPDKVSAEVQKLREFYKQDPRQESFNILCLGESGTGKSFLASTARKPVHIDSFDPGGSKGLKKWIDKGEIIVDSKYEGEDPKKPFAFSEWKKNFDGRFREGYFNAFGTYVLDSSTTWSEAIMNDILKKAGIAGEAPRYTKDYTPQKVEIRNYIRKMLDLPCDFIMTGHLELKEDPDKGHIFRFLTTGKGALIIPLLFDEIWITKTKSTSQGTEYQILTQADGLYIARSRLAQDGKLDRIEKPDIKALRKKVGLSIEDKPLLW
jgi:hypothetical protein